MSEKHIVYPIISQTRINTLVKELEELGATMDFVKANKGALALHIGADHLDKGPLDEIYDYLANAGFNNKICATLDRLYGSHQQYFTFKWKGGLWTAVGDNARDDDWTRVYITWHEKLDKDTKEEVLCEIN